MITAFRIGDALRCVLINAPGGPNLAAPTELVVRCRPLRNSTFWRQSLIRNPNRVTVGDWNGIDLSSLASARTRNGIRAWEVDRLHVKDAKDTDQALDLLEQLVVAAGAHGAEKIFLRLACDSQMVDLARRAGFFPYFEEIHLVGQVALVEKEEPSDAVSGDSGKYEAEDRAESDSYGLFQLYCAATPQPVRNGVGLTFDQWSDAQEQPRSHRDESVLNLDGKIVGWRMREPFGQAVAGQVLAHPNHPDVMPWLIEMSRETPNWLIPSYQENAVDLLARQGFQEAGRYTMLIKTVTVPVVNRELSYVEA